MWIALVSINLKKNKITRLASLTIKRDRHQRVPNVHNLGRSIICTRHDVYRVRSEVVWGRGQAEDGKRANAGHGDGCVDDWKSCGGGLSCVRGMGRGGGTRDGDLRGSGEGWRRES